LYTVKDEASNLWVNLHTKNLIEELSQNQTR
jgi:hypothetical protein